MKVAKWSSDVELIGGDDAIWYPFYQDIALLPAVTRNSLLYRLSERWQSDRLFEAHYGAKFSRRLPIARRCSLVSCAALARTTL
jgi:hypothetical protein